MNDQTKGPQVSQTALVSNGAEQQVTNRQLSTIPRSEVIPSGQLLDSMLNLSEELFKSGLLPEHIKSSAAAFGIIQKGRELNVPPMYACSNIIVIKGKPSCNAELMLALIYRDHGGKAITFTETNSEICTIKYSRRDTDTSGTLSYTIEDAQTAGLTTGKNSHTWRAYPAAMLRARCISAVARMTFTDTIGGMYTPEELGVVVDAEGYVIEDVESTPAHIDMDTGEIIETEAPALPEGMQKASEIDPNRITRPQLAKIYATAKEAGYDNKDDLDAFSRSEFGHRTSQLSKQDASQLIEMLIQMRDEQTVESEVVEGDPDITAMWNQAVAAKAPGVEGQDLAGWLYGHYEVGHPSELTPKQVRDAAGKLQQIIEAPF